MTAVRIDRCICLNRTFAELVALASAERLDLHAIAERTRCGTNCGYCVAYLKRALATGETVFTEILEKETLGL